MNAGLKFTLDVAQLVMLAGLVWGLSKMSSTVTELRRATEILTAKLEELADSFGSLVTRVAVLEDRRARRQP